jgi:hypothetical protein
MRTLFLSLLLIAGLRLLAQDTSSTWLDSIDSAAFSATYDKRNIPEELFSVIHIESLKDIANPGKPYRTGCVSYGTLPSKRLNWIASDNHAHWVISISSGGRGHSTSFYFIDREKGEITCQVLYFQVPDPAKLTLPLLIPELKAGRYMKGQ